MTSRLWVRGWITHSCNSQVPTAQKAHEIYMAQACAGIAWVRWKLLIWTWSRSRRILDVIWASVTGPQACHHESSGASPILTPRSLSHPRWTDLHKMRSHISNDYFMKHPGSFSSMWEGRKSVWPASLIDALATLASPHPSQQLRCRWKLTGIPCVGVMKKNRLTLSNAQRPLMQ